MPAFSSRWSQKHNRPLCGGEMLGIMGIPVLESLARSVSTTVPNLEKLSNTAKARQGMVKQGSSNNFCLEVQLSGNGMDVPCVGFTILCACLACCCCHVQCSASNSYYIARHFFAWRNRCNPSDVGQLIHSLNGFVS